MPRRALTQCYGVISAEAPSKTDEELDKTLEAYIEQNIKLEAVSVLRQREAVLQDLTELFVGWVRTLCLEQGMSEEIANEAGGCIFTSGSYRLSIHEPGADIDTICVAPRNITRQDFFSSLRDQLKTRPDVRNFVAVEAAQVPIMSFEMDGIKIDLGFATLPRASVPPDLDIDDDSILAGVDKATEKCVNGPRVTNMIHDLVPKYSTFLPVIRCVRKWARQRGLYSNKMGYLGGVNFNILVALTCQLYPNASPSSVLAKFFKLMAGWKWPNPIQLTPPYDAGLGYQVWSSQYNQHHVMPIITPAYPAMNSAANVSSHSLKVMTTEFKRADKLVQAIRQKGGSDWEDLFMPTQFFAEYPHYLALDIIAGSAEEHRSWVGYVESRLRKLVEHMGYLRNLFEDIHLWPMKELECCSGGINGELPAYCFSYFIGFSVTPEFKARKQPINISGVFDQFRLDTIGIARKSKFYMDGMDMVCTHFAFKNLPRFVWESIGGEEAATAIRRERRRARSEKAETESSLKGVDADVRLGPEQFAGRTGVEHKGDDEHSDDEDVEKPSTEGHVTIQGDLGFEGGLVEVKVGADGAVLSMSKAKVEPEAAPDRAEDAMEEAYIQDQAQADEWAGRKKRRRPEVSHLVTLDPVAPVWKRRKALARGNTRPPRRLAVHLLDQEQQ